MWQLPRYDTYTPLSSQCSREDWLYKKSLRQGKSAKHTPKPSGEPNWDIIAYNKLLSEQHHQNPLISTMTTRSSGSRGVSDLGDNQKLTSREGTHARNKLTEVNTLLHRKKESIEAQSSEKLRKVAKTPDPFEEKDENRSPNTDKSLPEATPPKKQENLEVIKFTDKRFELYSQKPVDTLVKLVIEMEDCIAEMMEEARQKKTNPSWPQLEMLKNYIYRTVWGSYNKQEGETLLRMLADLQYSIRAEIPPAEEAAVLKLRNELLEQVLGHVVASDTNLVPINREGLLLGGPQKTADLLMLQIEDLKKQVASQQEIEEVSRRQIAQIKEQLVELHTIRSKEKLTTEQAISEIQEIVRDKTRSFGMQSNLAGLKECVLDLLVQKDDLEAIKNRLEEKLTAKEATLSQYAHQHSNFSAKLERDDLDKLKSEELLRINQLELSNLKLIAQQYEADAKHYHIAKADISWLATHIQELENMLLKQGLSFLRQDKDFQNKFETLLKSNPRFLSVSVVKSHLKDLLSHENQQLYKDLMELLHQNGWLSQDAASTVNLDDFSVSGSRRLSEKAETRLSDLRDGQQTGVSRAQHEAGKSLSQPVFEEPEEQVSNRFSRRAVLPNRSNQSPDPSKHLEISSQNAVPILPKMNEMLNLDMLALQAKIMEKQLVLNSPEEDDDEIL